MAHYVIMPEQGWGLWKGKTRLDGGVLGAPSGKGANGSEFGKSVAISRDDSTIVIGAPGQDHGQGAVYYFHKPALGWTKTQNLINIPKPAGIADGSRFGAKVAVSADGKVVATSAPSTGGGIGAVYLFLVGGTDTNSPTITRIDIPVEPNDHGEGISVALSADGKTVAFGSLGPNNVGAVFAFGTAQGDWKDAKLIGSWSMKTPQPDDFFGFSVALSADGSKIIAGAPGCRQGDGNWLFLDIEPQKK
jgi:hypothetical protein